MLFKEIIFTLTMYKTHKHKILINRLLKQVIQCIQFTVGFKQLMQVYCLILNLEAGHFYTLKEAKTTYFFALLKTSLQSITH
jgi:hypothetical protein